MTRRLRRNADTDHRNAERIWRQSGLDRDAVDYAAIAIQNGVDQRDVVRTLAGPSSALGAVISAGVIRGFGDWAFDSSKRGDYPSHSLVGFLWEALEVQPFEEPDEWAESIEPTGDPQLPEHVQTGADLADWIEYLSRIECGITGFVTNMNNYTTDEGLWTLVETRSGGTVFISPPSHYLKDGETVDLMDPDPEDQDRVDDIISSLKHDGIRGAESVSAKSGWGATRTFDQYEWNGVYKTEDEALDALFEYDEDVITPSAQAELRADARKALVALMARISLVYNDRPPEIKPSRRRFRNATPLDQSALVLVHPGSLDSFAESFSDDDDDDTDDGDCAWGIDEAYELASSMIMAAVEHHGPVFLIDNPDTGGRIYKWFKTELERKSLKDLVVVPFSDGVDDWDTFLPVFTGRLKELGVKSAVVGGLWWDPSLKSGCATTAFTYLRDHLPGGAGIDKDILGVVSDARSNPQRMKMHNERPTEIKPSRRRFRNATPDDSLRSTERELLRSPSVASQSKLLVERMRSGELAPGRVILAAMFGDHAAKEATGYRGLLAPTDFRGLREVLDNVDVRAPGVAGVLAAWSIDCIEHARAVMEGTTGDVFDDIIIAARHALERGTNHQIVGGAALLEARVDARSALDRALIAEPPLGVWNPPHQKGVTYACRVVLEALLMRPSDYAQEALFKDSVNMTHVYASATVPRRQSDALNRWFLERLIHVSLD